jgi:transcriptional regulator
MARSIEKIKRKISASSKNIGVNIAYQRKKISSLSTEKAKERKAQRSSEEKAGVFMAWPGGG